jgi:hypothetical protein
VLHIAPLPIVRKIEIDVHQSVWDKLFKAYFDDELKRRMRVRVGAYLPWAPIERACQLYSETQRIREFLQDEGYFEARATIEQRVAGAAVQLEVEVELGPEYTVDVTRAVFPKASSRSRRRDPRSVPPPRDVRAAALLCYGTPRFSAPSTRPTSRPWSSCSLARLPGGARAQRLRARVDRSPTKKVRPRSRSISGAGSTSCSRARPAA